MPSPKVQCFSGQGEEVALPRSLVREAVWVLLVIRAGGHRKPRSEKEQLNAGQVQRLVATSWVDCMEMTPAGGCSAVYSCEDAAYGAPDLSCR